MFFSTTFKSARPSLLCAPMLWLGFVLVLLIALLSFRLNAPIGPMYWDSYIYFDAAQRIKMEQIPGVDFSTPVGPLGYYLLHGDTPCSRRHNRFCSFNGQYWSLQPL